MRSVALISVSVFLLPYSALAFLGTELGPLLQLVSGQITEIEKLSESINATRDQTKTLRELNDGIEQAVMQIRNIQAIIERTQGVDPRAVRSLSDLNDLLDRAHQTKQAIDDLMQAKVDLADQAIAGSALQGDTAYRMGQEMVVTGSQLSAESQTASPGRASQIAASANSAQMLATGVELQTLAQLVQLQAMTLDFQKGQVAREIQTEKVRRAAYERQLTLSSKAVR